MSLNELVDLYNKQLNSTVGGRSTIGTDLSHRTPQSTFTMNTGFESVGDRTTATVNNNNNNYNFQFTPSASSAFIFESDASRFHINDRVLSGEIVRPPPHNPPRIEHIKQADKVVFSTGENEVDDYEHNQEYTSKYPDIKPQLNIVSAQQAKIPPLNLFTNPGEQIQRLINQGKLTNLHGYINYPYNYIEPPWYFTQFEEQQGHVNFNPPRTHLTANDIQSNAFDDSHDLQLPYTVPQGISSQDRYEIIPLPKMVYENFVPLIATRRIVYRRQTAERVTGERLQNASDLVSKLPEVEEMTYKF